MWLDTNTYHHSEFEDLETLYQAKRESELKISICIPTLNEVYHEYDISVFAQTDLDQRVHRNQSTAALGKMTCGNLQSLLPRLESHGKVTQHQAISNIYRALELSDGKCKELTSEIIEEERPPMVEIKEYLERFPRK